MPQGKKTSGRRTSTKAESGLDQPAASMIELEARERAKLWLSLKQLADTATDVLLDIHEEWKEERENDR